MKNFRIIFVETDLRGGNMVDVEMGTRWMTAEEIEVSPFLQKRGARVVTR